MLQLFHFSACQQQKTITAYTKMNTKTKIKQLKNKNYIITANLIDSHKGKVSFWETVTTKNIKLTNTTCSSGTRS